MEKAQKTTKVITSWITFNCATLNVPCPIRLAGTWKQYSKKTEGIFSDPGKLQQREVCKPYSDKHGNGL